MKLCGFILVITPMLGLCLYLSFVRGLKEEVGVDVLISRPAWEVAFL